jgi:hypothetical protein
MSSSFMLGFAIDRADLSDDKSIALKAPPSQSPTVASGGSHRLTSRHLGGFVGSAAIAWLWFATSFTQYLVPVPAPVGCCTDLTGPTCPFSPLSTNTNGQKFGRRRTAQGTLKKAQPGVPGYVVRKPGWLRHSATASWRAETGARVPSRASGCLETRFPSLLSEEVSSL